MQQQNDNNQPPNVTGDQQQMNTAYAMQQQLLMGQGQMGNMMNPGMMQQMGFTGGAQGANGQALQQPGGMMGMNPGMLGQYMSGQPNMGGG